jgi:alkylation response protein AidB-like acyl-CoA dehydrogenase
VDVDIPDIPHTYDDYRRRLVDFLQEAVPRDSWRPGTGLRAPPTRADVDALRTWVSAIYEQGYFLQRFSMDELDVFEQRILTEELNKVGLPYVLGNPLVAGAIKIFGSSEQRDFYLPKMASGEHIWTQLFSEPDAGSDLGSLRTKAVQQGDEYIVDGQKIWSTWAHWADYGYLLARTGTQPGSSGITAFILDLHSPGVEIRPLREITGTIDFNEVFLTDVRIPKENVLGPVGGGWQVANESLATERSGVGAQTIEAFKIVDDLVDLARRKSQSEKKEVSDDVRRKIGSYVARVRIQKALEFSTLTKGSSNSIEAWDAPLGKIWFSELNIEMVDLGLSLEGPSGALVEGDPESVDNGIWQDRFLHERAWTIAGGSNEIMRNLIAERGLGLPREPR